MIVLILHLLPALLYAATWRVSWRSTVPGSAADRPTGAANPTPAPRAARDNGAGWLLPLALVLHAAALVWVPEAAPVRFGFAKALSAMSWIGLAVVWLEGRRFSLEALRLLLLPLAILSVLLPLAFPGVELGEIAQRPLFLPHLLAGTLAYGVLLLGALDAVLMLWVRKDLHRTHAQRERSGFVARVIDRLPPLLVLERMLFNLIRTGFVLLLLTTLSGMLFSEEVFGRPFRFEHKTVFSLLSLGFFGVLLVGRATHGWRGRIAMRFTLWGFLILLLAYVGTHFVLEVVLRRM
jgi:ABC-type uncharacterized transport system permease subunit